MLLALQQETSAHTVEVSATPSGLDSRSGVHGLKRIGTGGSTTQLT